MLDKSLFNSNTKLVTYAAKVWRMVETQETAATLNLVDSMEEQDMLETLLDEVKPRYRIGTEGMHYLLKTAFRYPPLKYGSRFGTRALPSFFYASEQEQTALAETAYYRFVFLNDMQDPYLHSIDSRHSMFNITAKSMQCLDIRSAKFKTIHKQLIHPQDYSTTQAIGNWATNQRHVEIILFESARHKSYSNVAIVEPKAIRSRTPNSMHTWLCRTTVNKISFSSREAGFPVIYPIEYFRVDDEFPRPAYS